jgi:quercetin dioxygenase-like cupin family protein
MTTTPPNVLLRSEETDGVVSVIEVASSGERPGPPFHRHDFDEAFYVLEGELTFRLRDEVFARRSGELAFAPRNVPHTYANLSGRPARALIVCTPAGFERMFDKSGPFPEVVKLGPPLESAHQTRRTE